jgi:hypothetical protein
MVENGRKMSKPFSTCTFKIRKQKRSSRIRKYGFNQIKYRKRCDSIRISILGPDSRARDGRTEPRSRSVGGRPAAGAVACTEPRRAACAVAGWGYWAAGAAPTLSPVSRLPWGRVVRRPSGSKEYSSNRRKDALSADGVRDGFFFFWAERAHGWVPNLWYWALSYGPK